MIDALRVRLAERGLQARAISPSALLDLEQAIGCSIPTELRSALTELGDLPSLPLDGTTLVACLRADAARVSAGEFPHGNEEARALSRPGELAFTGNIDPEGAATLGRDDSSISYLVMRGEQAGSVWLGCAYGLCPLFEVVNDQAAPVGFLRWYSLALDRLVSEPEALTSESAEPLGNPPRDSPAGEVLQPGDEQRLRGRIALADTLVEVEPGDYALTEPIVISRPLTVRAAGTVILRVADVGAAVRVASAGVVLEGLRVCAQAAAPGAGVGVEVVDGASVHVVSLSASGLALALRVDARAALRAEGIEVTGCLEGIVAQGELELDDSQLTSCEVGIVLRAQAKAHIRRCTLRNCLNTAVKIESGCCSLINNRIEGSGRDGIELAGGRLTADRNEVTGTGGVGVLVAGGRAIVRSNVISRAYVGISARCFLLATNNLITQAQVGIQGEQGLVLERSRVRGNVVHGCGYDGIDLRSGDFDLAFNQVGWNRQTGLSLREEGSALLSVIVRDNVLYFHALDGAHVEMESDGLPALLEYNSAFENLRSGYRVSGTSIVIFTRNSASHNQRAGFSIESQAYAALFEDETTSSGLFGIVVWGEAGFGAHRTRHTRDGLAALGSFGTRSSARDEVVEPSTLPTWCTFPRSGRSNGRRSNVSAEVAAAASKPRTITLERAELLERYAQEPGFARTRTAWEGDHPLRCAATDLPLAGPARVIIGLADGAANGAPAPAMLPLLVVVLEGRIVSVARSAALQLMEPSLRSWAGLPPTAALEEVVTALLSVPTFGPASALRAALVEDRFFLGAALVAASGASGPTSRGLRKRLAKLRFEPLLHRALAPSSIRDSYLAATLAQRRALKGELLWCALFSAWQGLPNELREARPRHPMLAAALGELESMFANSGW